MLGPGDYAPNISGKDIISGGQISLSNYSGKVICLALVQYSCNNCAQELPLLESLWKKFEDEGVQILANLDPFNSSTIDEEKAWMASLIAEGITFPVIHDLNDVNRKKYSPGSYHYPTLFIINCKREISYCHYPQEAESITESQILDAILGCCLNIRSKGSLVKALQCILNLEGASPALTIDGIFGPKTKTAVMAFQESHGLVQDGIVGPKTWEALLNTLLLKVGSKDSAVKGLQFILNLEGASPALTIDGIFGPKTKTAVIAIQQSHGLVQDGIVGPKTWKALMRY
jgi:peroxiredoxin